MAGGGWIQKTRSAVQLFLFPQNAENSPSLQVQNTPLSSVTELDPGVSLSAMWLKLRLEYFPERGDIDLYDVRWSDRSQRRCLASCNVKHRSVNVAGALRDPAARHILEPLLYHEMCHAALGALRSPTGRRVWHGREFRLLERRHPGIPVLDQWIQEGYWDSLTRRSRRRARRSSSRLQRGRRI